MLLYRNRLPSADTKFRRKEYKFPRISLVRLLAEPEIAERESENNLRIENQSPLYSFIYGVCTKGKCMGFYYEVTMWRIGDAKSFLPRKIYFDVERKF